MALGAPRPRDLRLCGDQRGRDVAEEGGLGTGGGKGDADAGGGLDDTGAEFQQAQADGGKLGNGERLALGDGVANGEDQPISSGVEDQPHLVACGWRHEVRSEAS